MQKTNESIKKIIKSYGSWPSSLTADVLADKGKRYGNIFADNYSLYWLEFRASEKGRGVLLKSLPNGKIEEVLPSNISVRTKVHEMGGGDFIVRNNIVYYSNAKDNRIYRFDEVSKTDLPMTPLYDNKEVRYADFAFCENKNILIAVRETHQTKNDSIENGLKKTVINDLIAIDLNKHEITVIHSDFDFYSFPRVTLQEDKLCWTCWNHPGMPWDSAELWMADLHQGGKIDAAHYVCGGDGVAIFQPEWSDGGVIHYVSDVSGWGNIYSHTDGLLNALTPTNRDFNTPQWIFGLGTYVINSDGSLYALCFDNGEQSLYHIDPSNGHTELIELPFTHFEGALQSDEDSLYFCAASPTQSVAMYRFNKTNKEIKLLSEKNLCPLSINNISIAQSINFHSVNGRESHAFYYPPKNEKFESDKNDLPPLIVMSHGGPTGYCDNSLDLNIQFWTNRGFAVVDVNYGGSTGFGKEYRESLNGHWGIVDVEDCIAAAHYLVKEKLADPKALLIRGGSAGGYTTLCALTFYDVFSAGMSRYGVADLESLASDTHKFEARYLDNLVGKYPQEKTLYQKRSPINFVDQLSCPILLLQGEDDKIVPPNQAEQMVTALKNKKIPYSYLLFKNEGHGFRQAETIIQAFNAELYFYRKILNIESDEKMSKVDIHYL